MSGFSKDRHNLEVSSLVARSRTEDATAPALIDRLVGSTSGKSVASLAELLGVTTQAIYNAKNKCKIPKSWIIDVAEGTGVSADWLLTGQGLVYDPSRVAVEEFTCESPCDAPLASIKVQPPKLASVNTEGTLDYIDCEDCHLAMIPMVEARLSAGSGSFEVGEASERRYAFRMDFLTRKGQPSSMVLMRVDGDSMEPHIFNNDTVLIDQSQTKPRAGGLYAVGVEDVVYIKMVDTLPGKIILKSYNPEYPPLEVDARGDLADGIRIIGRAVWIGRELY